MRWLPLVLAGLVSLGTLPLSHLAPDRLPAIALTAATQSASAASLVTPRPIPGDADCDMDVSAADALHVLRYLARVGTPAGCIVSSGNVKCDDSLDAVDALTILRHVAGIRTELPPGCPQMETPFVPPEIHWLKCDPIIVSVGEPALCDYALSATSLAPTTQWSFADASVRYLVLAMSASCGPNDSACVWGESGRYELVFNTAGTKTVSLTACSGSACSTVSVSISVES